LTIHFVSFHGVFLILEIVFQRELYTNFKRNTNVAKNKKLN